MSSHSAFQVPLCLLALALPLQADVLYVSVGLTTGDSDGSSWEDAFQGEFGLQAALAAALPGDQIYIAQGVYFPAPEGQREVSFQLPSGVELYGGFLGTEDSPSERPQGSTSWLSGDLARDDFLISFDDNSHHVVEASQAGSGSLLDSFAIVGGNALDAPEPRGAGLVASGSGQAQVRNCTFFGNRADLGGAVYLSGTSTEFTFIDCTFEENQADIGAAVVALSSPRVTLSGCELINNGQAHLTSSVALLGGAFAELDACRILEEQWETTGLFLGFEAEAVVRNSIFSLIALLSIQIQDDTALRLESCTLQARAILGLGQREIVNSILFQAGNGAFALQEGAMVRSSLVEGGYPGEAILDADPMLEPDSLRPLPTSPVLDRGNNLLLTGSGLDAAGAPRLVDCPTAANEGVGVGPLVDLGAFEFQNEGSWIFCDGPSNSVDCPCGNEGEAGSGCTNALLGGARLEVFDGSTSVSLDDLQLRTVGLFPLQSGLLYMGPQSTQVPLGDGLRCITTAGLGTFRYPMQSTGTSGSIVEGPGLVDFSRRNFSPQAWIEPGDTWLFQVWYRDPFGPCGLGSNLSNGLAVTFTP